MTFTYKVIAPWGGLRHTGQVTAKNERGARIAIGKRHHIGWGDIVIVKEVERGQG